MIGMKNSMSLKMFVVLSLISICVSLMGLFGILSLNVAFSIVSSVSYSLIILGVVTYNMNKQKIRMEKYSESFEKLDKIGEELVNRKSIDEIGIELINKI